MKSVELHRSSNNREPLRKRPYLTPSCQQIGPQKAKELLLQDPQNASDPTVRAMLDRIDKILTKDGPE